MRVALICQAMNVIYVDLLVLRFKAVLVGALAILPQFNFLFLIILIVVLMTVSLNSLVAFIIFLVIPSNEVLLVATMICFNLNIRTELNLTRLELV